MKSLCNRRVSGWNPDTLKEIVRFVDEVHPVFVVTLSTFLHMLCGWNDDTMPTFNLFRVHLKCFSISRSFSSLNKLVNDWKIANDVRMCWKLMTSLWMVHRNTKKSGVQISLKKWSARVTYEFLSETLILQKRLSSLYTRWVQFSLWPSLLFCTCYAGEMIIPCQLSTFSEFIWNAFQF